MATKKKAAPTQDLLNLNPEIVTDDLLNLGGEAVDFYGNLIPKTTKTEKVDDPFKQAQQSIYDDLRWLEAKDKIQERLAKNAPPPKIPRWEQVAAQIQGYDDLPYKEKDRLYNQWLQEAKELFIAWNDNQPKKKQMDALAIDKMFEEYNPAPVKPERSWGDLLNDLSTGALQGGAAFMGTVTSLLDSLAGTPKQNSKYWDDLVEAYDKEKSEYTKDQRKLAAFELQKLYSDPEKSTVGRLLGEAGIALSTLTVDQAISLVVQMAPSVFMGIATGGLGTAAGLGVQGAARAASIAGIITNAALTGGDAAATARDIALNLTEEQIKSTDKGRELWSRYNGDIDKVRNDLAIDASRSGLALGAALGTAGAAIPGSAERAISSAMRGGTRGVLGAMAAGSLIGATEEGLTGVAGRAAGNLQGGNEELLKGAASDFTLGLLGEGLGAGIGHIGGKVIGRGAAENLPATAQNAQQTVSQILAQGGSQNQNQNASPTAGVTQSDVDAVKQALAEADATLTGATQQAAPVDTTQAAATAAPVDPNIVAAAAAQQAAAQTAQAAAQQQAATQTATPPVDTTQAATVQTTQQTAPVDTTQVTTPPAGVSPPSIDTTQQAATQTAAQTTTQPAAAPAASASWTPVFERDGYRMNLDPASGLLRWTDSDGNIINYNSVPQDIRTEAMTEYDLSPSGASQALSGINRIANSLSPADLRKIAKGEKVDGISDAIASTIRRYSLGQTVQKASLDWTKAVLRNEDSRQVLQKIADDQRVGESARNVAADVLTAFNKSKTEVPKIVYEHNLVDEKGRPAEGKYDIDTNTITLSKDASATTVAHEVMHAITCKGILDLEAKALKGNAAARNKLALLQHLVNRVREETGEGTLYGTESVAEMVAELVSPEFIAAAQRTKLGDVSSSVEYTTLTQRNGKPVKIKGNPQAAMKQLGINKGNSVVSAIAKFIKSLADALAPQNKITEQTVLDTLQGTLEWITPNRRPRTRAEVSTQQNVQQAVDTTQQQAATQTTTPPVDTTQQQAATEPAASQAAEPSVQAEAEPSAPVQEAEPVIEETVVPPEQIEEVTETELPENAKLDRNLKKTSPRYEGTPVRFESDLDRAAFMLGTRTKHAEEYRNFIKDHLGYTDKQIDDYVNDIYQRVKKTAVKGGQRFIESTSKIISNVDTTPLYARKHAAAAAGQASSASTVGTSRDSLLAAAQQQGIPNTSRTFSSVFGNIQNGTPAPAATLGRNVYQSAVTAAKTRNATGLKNAISGVLDWMGEKFADSMLPVKRWSDGILDRSDHLHEPVTNFQSAMYGAPNRRDHFMVEAHRNGGAKYLKNIAAVVKKTGLSEETVQQRAGYWLSAKWAPEANNRLLKRAVAEVQDATKQLSRSPNNADLQQQLRDATKYLQDLHEAITNTDIYVDEHKVGVAGGMNNAQAAAMRAQIENEIGLDNLKSIAEGVYDMNAWRLALDIEIGKTTPEAAVEFLNRPDLIDKLEALRDAAAVTDYDPDALNTMRAEVAKDVRSEYVPLTGDPLSSIDEDSFGGVRSPNVSADKRMLGRQSIPDDGISASFASMMKSTGFAGWRPFQQATADLYLAMSPAERVEAGLGMTKYNRGDATPQGAIIYRSGGNTYAFEVDGQLFDAIRKANIEQDSTILQFIGKPTKWFSYAATQLNPMFGPINTIRDMWERSDLVRSKDLRDANGNKVDAEKVGRSMWRYMFNPEVWTAAYRFAAGKNTNSHAGKALQILSREGGLSTRADYFGASKAKQAQAIAATRSKTGQAANALGRVIDIYNRTFDLISPLSSYLAMEEQGVTRTQASGVTLDLMNFRKSGTAMPFVRSMYAFAQPAVTSGVNLLSSLIDRKSGKLRWKSVARLAAYTFVLASIQAAARAIAGEDEGGEKWRQLSDWTLNNTIPFPVGDKFITVPLGFGYPRLANSMARAMLDMAKNEQTVGQAFGSVVTDAMIPAISPIEPVAIDWGKHPAEAFMLTFSPTWLRPIVENSVNMRATGAPITHPEWEKTDQFRSEQGGTNVPGFYREVVSIIRSMTGNRIDMAPEQFANLFRGYTVGAPAMLRTQFIDNPFRAEQGRVVDNPVTRRFVMSQTDQGVRSQFYEYQGRINDIRKKINVGEDISSEEKALLRIGDQWNAVDKDFRSKLSKIAKNKGMSPEMKAKAQAAIRKQRDPYIFDFVRRARRAENKITN